MNFMLDIGNVNISEPISDFGDRLLYAGQMLLIGMATVFSVLVVLMIALVLFKFFFHDLPKRQKKVVSDSKAETVTVAPTASVSNDEEIIAVIAAAIAMAENECGGNKQFRVVSFNRK